VIFFIVILFFIYINYSLCFCHTLSHNVFKGFYFGSLCCFFRVFKSLFCFLFYIISFSADANFLLFASRWCDSFSLLCSVNGGPSSIARNGKGERESIDRLVNSCLACFPSLNGTINYFTRRGFINFSWMILFYQLFNSHDCRSFTAVKSDETSLKRTRRFETCERLELILIEYFCLLPSCFFFSLISWVLCAERHHENSGHKNTSWSSARRIPRAPNSTIPPATLRSSFQPGDTSKAQFSSRFFLLVRDEDAPYIYSADVPAEDQHRHFQRQLGANRDFGPLDARVFRGVFPPFLCPPHPRDPLISGLRGSRNEPSEARWHEEGNVGWAVGGGAVQNYAIATSQRSHPSASNPLCRPARQPSNNPRLRTRHRCCKRSIFEDIDGRSMWTYWDLNIEACIAITVDLWRLHLSFLLRCFDCRILWKSIKYVA